MPVETCIEALNQRFPGVDFAPGPLNPTVTVGAAQICLRVAPDRLIEVLDFLADDPRTRFDQLGDLTCVDYLEYPEARDRFGVIYNLVSTSLNHRLFVKSFVNDPDPRLPSVTDIWRGAEWLEREVFDMFGIRFDGHPDLRRILTWDGFKAHPLRKDYPLRGRGEREAFKVIGRESA
jgi:NADH-quinone oxidoreductase subunit C